MRGPNLGANGIGALHCAGHLRLSLLVGGVNDARA